MTGSELVTKKNDAAALILIDSPAVRQVVAKAAQDAGYAVHIVETRSEAFDAIRGEKPALMITGLRMIDGTGVLHEIGIASPGTALVMLIEEDQAAADIESLAMAAGVGTAVAVHRPIRMRDLSEAIERARPSSAAASRSDDTKALEIAIAAAGIDVDFLPRVVWQGSGDPIVVGCEANASWQSADRGRVDHNALMCLARQGGLSDPLMRIIVRAVGRHARHLEAAGKETLPAVVALSPAIVHDAKAAASIAAMLREEGLAPSQLIVKISEPAATADPVALGTFLEMMTMRGIAVSLSNFGSSMVCVPELARAGFAEVVLDATLVASLKGGDRARNVVRALVAMASALGFDVCADGVDCAASARFLAALGCRVQQGRHFHEGLALRCAGHAHPVAAAGEAEAGARGVTAKVVGAFGRRVPAAVSGGHGLQFASA
ncbi:EAL domain-containing protein [Acuticoccus sp. MNP-M23]|uniref:EAL domain-containing response regulator n=1 Tax=Acuticoccus sp. MNP-M23 TaxID=3072793 RepID=UPI002815C4D3|nr:EAL domain-containing protein [Acuticoccus sp. MNP-M23]WMS42974.1 EAL domain-containing protein [Acuticoccus sp. MNP-M23]